MERVTGQGGAYKEEMRGLHQAHNNSRDRLHKEKMQELQNVCKIIDNFASYKEYFETILSCIK